MVSSISGLGIAKTKAQLDFYLQHIQQFFRVSDYLHATTWPLLHAHVLRAFHSLIVIATDIAHFPKMTDRRSLHRKNGNQIRARVQDSRNMKRARLPTRFKLTC
jgi:hypothetical protein